MGRRSGRWKGEGGAISGCGVDGWRSGRESGELSSPVAWNRGRQVNQLLAVDRTDGGRGGMVQGLQAGWRGFILRVALTAVLLRLFAAAADSNPADDIRRCSF